MVVWATDGARSQQTASLTSKNALIARLSGHRERGSRRYAGIDVRLPVGQWGRFSRCAQLRTPLRVIEGSG